MSVKAYLSGPRIGPKIFSIQIIRVMGEEQ